MSSSCQGLGLGFRVRVRVRVRVRLPCLLGDSDVEVVVVKGGQGSHHPYHDGHRMRRILPSCAPLRCRGEETGHV